MAKFERPTQTPVARLRRKSTGAYMPKDLWRLNAEKSLAPLRRKRFGSLTAKVHMCRAADHSKSAAHPRQLVERLELAGCRRLRDPTQRSRSTVTSGNGRCRNPTAVAAQRKSCLVQTTLLRLASKASTRRPTGNFASTGGNRHLRDGRYALVVPRSSAAECNSRPPRAIEQSR